MLVRTTPEIDRALHAKAPIAIGVSGGKDSCAVTLALKDYLDSIAYPAPVVLIHSDLGRVEWQQSLGVCEVLSKTVGYPLLVVRRKAGDMLARWQQRWHNNVERYVNLECVKLILPWSSASLRFCTSEMKSSIICQELKNQFPGKEILSVTGIRAAESANRAKTPLCQVSTRLIRKKDNTRGYDWHPIHHWSTPEVYDYLAKKEFVLHEAYTKYGSSRVSCCYCVMASKPDLIAAASCLDNQEVYRQMVELEIQSTFSFHSNIWLGDIAPHLLTPAMQQGLAAAKVKATQRQNLEKRIPKDLQFVLRVPLCVPTETEAAMLAEVRSGVGNLLGIQPNYVDPKSIQDRFDELLQARGEQILDGPQQLEFAQAA